MRFHRFYFTEKVGNKTDLTIESAELANQINRVFRLKKGDGVIVFDGSGNDYECKIVDFNQESVMLKVGEGNPSRYIPARKVCLYQAIIKKDKFEWIVEKATELGVTDIIPVLAERSEKKSLNKERLQKIAIEASEQSGRGDVPVVHEISSPKLTVEIISDFIGEKIALHLEGLSLEVARVTFTHKAQPLAIFIGPEGGWSPTEIDMFHTLKVPIYSLGKQILRSETAAVVALAKMM